MKNFFQLMMLSTLISLSLSFQFCKCPEEEIPENIFTLYQEANLSGASQTYDLSNIREKEIIVTKTVAFDNIASSISYDLADGIVLTLFDNDNCTGKPVTLTGKGSLNFSEKEMDNLVSSFWWNLD